MNEPIDWLEQTWEIKRNIARRYAGIPMSEQLRDMHARVLDEFRKRNWDYPDLSRASLPKSEKKGAKS